MYEKNIYKECSYSQKFILKKTKLLIKIYNYYLKQKASFEFNTKMTNIELNYTVNDIMYL